MTKKLIGPHEGKEFELLDSGRKNVAFFHDIIPGKYHLYKLRAGYDCIELSKGEIPYVILFKTEFREDAQELEQIINTCVGFTTEAYERRIGEILGYSEEAIDFYLARSKKRGYLNLIDTKN